MRKQSVHFFEHAVLGQLRILSFSYDSSRKGTYMRRSSTCLHEWLSTPVLVMQRPYAFTFVTRTAFWRDNVLRPQENCTVLEEDTSKITFVLRYFHVLTDCIGLYEYRGL